MVRVARWSLLAVIGVWVLVGSLFPIELGAVAAAAAASEESDSDDLLALPALPASESEGSDAAVVDGEYTAPSLAEPVVAVPDLQATARELGSELGSDVPRGGLEVVERSELVTTYERSDGATVERISLQPQNVQLADGEWVESSTSVEGTGDGWKVGEHPLAPEFGTDAGADDAVTLNRDGHAGLLKVWLSP